MPKKTYARPRTGQDEIELDFDEVLNVHFMRTGEDDDTPYTLIMKSGVTGAKRKVVDLLSTTDAARLEQLIVQAMEADLASDGYS